MILLSSSLWEILWINIFVVSTTFSHDSFCSDSQWFPHYGWGALCAVWCCSQVSYQFIIYISISFTSREIVKKITGLVSQGFWRPNQSWMHLSKKVRTDKVIYLFVSFIWIIFLCYFSSTFLFNLNNFPILLY